jgi:peptidoglycan/LPS O-acetylase OafA/YrhL
MTAKWASAVGVRGVVLPPGLFRLLLAAAVLLSHLSRFDVGRLAVLLFFYLSGYWVTRVWEAKFGPRATLRFYAARYLRIAPLYLLALVAAALLNGVRIAPENVVLFGTATTAHDPIGVSWSLDIELQFYVLLPALVLLLRRLNGLTTIVLSMTLAIAGIALESSVGVHTVLKFLPAFLLGLMTFTRRWRPSQRIANLSLAAFLVVTAVTAFTPFMDKTSPNPFDEDIWSFFWMLPLLPYVARSLEVRSTSLDRHAGNLSYPLYLVHVPVVTFLEAHMAFGAGGKLLALALSGLAALVLYLVIDRPVDRWRVRLTEGAPARSPEQELTPAPKGGPFGERIGR